MLKLVYSDNYDFLFRYGFYLKRTINYVVKDGALCFDSGDIFDSLLPHVTEKVFVYRLDNNEDALYVRILFGDTNLLDKDGFDLSVDRIIYNYFGTSWRIRDNVLYNLIKDGYMVIE